MKFSTYTEYQSHFLRNAKKDAGELREPALDRRTVLGLENRSELDAMIWLVNHKNRSERSNK